MLCRIFDNNYNNYSDNESVKQTESTCSRDRQASRYFLSLSLFLWRHFSRSAIFYGPHARFRNTPYITVGVQGS